ncbi:MAG TPA: TM0106 family RecB-like putative nuclease, partial [Patescibacteria group bacterium]|nr:TM0106 family RecB-like putative nuclease [Patescibacteria group bacterium]
SHPAIINADHECLPFAAADFTKSFADLTDALLRIRAGEMPEPVYRKACEDTSPWGKACFRLAKERQDIALLFNVDVKKLKALRDLGIRTIDDAADLNPETLEGQAPGLTFHALQTVARQAQSLRDESVIIRKPYPKISPEAMGLEIHFDIESHPPTDRDYLYGFWIREKEGERYQAFVAERPEDEAKMWRAFLAWLPQLPSAYTVFHYGNYESARLSILANRYGDQKNPWLEKFRSRLMDVKEIVRETAVFPIYFYSLKKIGTFLGFSWNGEVKEGGASVDAYDAWRASGDRTILNAILQYNKEDVQATAYVMDWLCQYAEGEAIYCKPYPWSLAMVQRKQLAA